MRLVPKLYLSFGILLAIALLGGGMAWKTARETAFQLERTHFAHRQYESYLALSNHTYQLFKQFGDAMLIGDRDQGAGETALIAEIRADIATLRSLIGQEIELVGEEEIEELDRLSAIETQIEFLLAEYANLVEDRDAARFSADWGRLSHVLDERVDRDFNALIEEALADEEDEVRTTRAQTAGRVSLFKIVAGIFGLIAVAAAGASLALLIRDIRRPIGRLLTGTRSFAAGDLGYRIEAGGRGELDDLGHAFNRMADEISTRETALAQSNVRLEQAVTDRTAELERVLGQLKANEENRRRLLADVSHELRTPLTIIQGEADIALRGGASKPSEVYREALEKAREAAKHTGRLVDDLLFVARREAGQARLNIGEVDLARLVSDVIDENRSLSEGRSAGISFVGDVGRAVVRADRDRIRQVLVILLENALRYGDGRVEVRLHGAPSGYAVSVANDGPGMTEEEQARAFDRFFRGSNAAGRYREGAGLGLPVAKSIVEAHGGTIALRSGPGEGVTVSFILPARPRLEAVR